MVVHAFGDDALGWDDAVALAGRIRRREVSSLEAVEAALTRLATVEPRLGAVAFDDADRARARARGIPADGEGALAGVPTATKDNIHVAGMPLTFGSAALGTERRTRDGGFTRQLRATGLNPICSTTTPEFGWTAGTERVGGLATRNPWSTDHSAGGSSGGSAALVAAGVLPIAHGNDGGGSIRIPAAACGLVGLKPTRGRTLRDVRARMPVDLVSNGVLTRTVRDTAAFLADMERVWRRRALPPVGRVTGPGRRLRIGVLLDSPMAPATDAETRRVVVETAEALAALGHDVREVPPTARGLPASFPSDFLDNWSMLGWFVAHRGGEVFGTTLDPARLDPMTLGLAARFRSRARQMPGVTSRLLATRGVWSRMLRSYDVALTPVVCHTTPRIGHFGADQPFEQHLERLLAYVGFTPWHNACGAPSMSLPTGRTRDGLPVGVLLSGRFGAERTLLQVGLEIEEAQPFARIDG